MGGVFLASADSVKANDVNVQEHARTHAFVRNRCYFCQVNMSLRARVRVCDVSRGKIVVRNSPAEPVTPQCSVTRFAPDLSTSSGASVVA